MKKSFLILGVIGSICMTNAYAGLVGEVLGAGDRGFMACPPDCQFLRNANGGLVTPVTCVLIPDPASNRAYHSMRDLQIDRMNQLEKK